MNTRQLYQDINVWLGDEKSIGASAIAAPLAMTLSIAIFMVAVKLQMNEIVFVAGITAALSFACHVWFALLRSRLVVALYQYIFVRWGNASVEAIAPIRRRARSLVVGTIGSWVIAGMQLLWFLSVQLVYKFPDVIIAYAIVIVVSCAYSTGFIFSLRALRSEFERTRDIEPACKIQL
jgi:hypothetical protein